MHGLIEIHTGSKIIGNIYYYRKFLLILNFWKMYNRDRGCCRLYVGGYCADYEDAKDSETSAAVS